MQTDEIAIKQTKVGLCMSTTPRHGPPSPDSLCQGCSLKIVYIWANTIGQGASRAVERVIGEYVENEGIGRESGGRKFELDNGWRIQFAAEPDVAFFDQRGVKRIAVEIKGSLDLAGAQTRYGEAKKSFAKQLAENPRCHTVYLASCFTDAVIRQIRADGQVREWFNLTSILYDIEERDRFLNRIFHIVNTPI